MSNNAPTDGLSSIVMILLTVALLSIGGLILYTQTYGAATPSSNASIDIQLPGPRSQ
jgi:hypothetical protein